MFWLLLFLHHSLPEWGYRWLFECLFRLVLNVLDVPCSDVGHSQEHSPRLNLLACHVQLSVLGNQSGRSPVHHPLELVVHRIVFLRLPCDRVSYLRLLLRLGSKQLLLQFCNPPLLFGQLRLVAFVCAFCRLAASLLLGLLVPWVVLDKWHFFYHLLCWLIFIQVLVIAVLEFP